jgi:hypothetical protein
MGPTSCLDDSAFFIEVVEARVTPDAYTDFGLMGRGLMQASEKTVLQYEFQIPPTPNSKLSAWGT